MSDESDIEIPPYMLSMSDDGLKRYLGERGHDITGFLEVLRTRAKRSLRRTALVPKVAQTSGYGMEMEISDSHRPLELQKVNNEFLGGY